MATAAQVEANRRNAQMSTGPRTPEGKLRSSANASTHGLTAKSALLPGEDPEQWQAWRQDIFDEFQPRPGLEERLVEIIARNLWRLERASRIETDVLRVALIDTRDPANEPGPDSEAREGLGRAYAFSQHTLRSLNRHQGACTRELRYAVDQVERLRAQRRDRGPDESSRGEPTGETPVAERHDDES